MIGTLMMRRSQRNEVRFEAVFRPKMSDPSGSHILGSFGVATFGVSTFGVAAESEIEAAGSRGGAAGSAEEAGRPRERGAFGSFAFFIGLALLFLFGVSCDHIFA